MAGPFKKLIAGGDVRRTRIHDELGQRVPVSRILTNMPRAIATGLGRLVLGRLPARPWISYAAQSEIDAFLTSRPTARILEFGSGQSTAWYAERCKEIVSLENNRAWFDRISPQLSAIQGIDYRFVGEPQSYAHPDVNGEFDLVMIDGPWRDLCAESAMAVIKVDGVIYLDNSDKGANPEEGDVPAARERLIAFAEKQGRVWQEFTDFAPSQLFVQRGLWIGPKQSAP